MARPSGIPHTAEWKKQASVRIAKQWRDGVRKGHAMSDEQRNIRRALHKEWLAKNGHPCRGVSPSEESKQKKSEALKGKPWTYDRYMAELPNMLRRMLERKQDTKDTQYHVDWKTIRFAIYRRDNFVCQLCMRSLNKNTGIACHHIDYRKMNNSCDNLITLCSSCHAKTNVDRSNWIVLFQDKMLMKNKSRELSTRN